MKPSLASHPPLHAHCANNGYVKAANSAVDTQLAPSLHRSAPLASGIRAAIPAPNNCSSSTISDDLAIANPHAAYESTATANTTTDASIECAALRERINPVLMSIKPAAANGTSSMHKSGKIAGSSGIVCRASRREMRPCEQNES